MEKLEKLYEAKPSNCTQLTIRRCSGSNTRTPLPQVTAKEGRLRRQGQAEQPHHHADLRSAQEAWYRQPSGGPRGRNLPAGQEGHHVPARDRAA